MDPAMADSGDKLVSTAGACRLLMARDLKAALEEMGYGDVMGRGWLDDIRFPDPEKSEDFTKASLDVVHAIADKCGFKDFRVDHKVSVDSVRDKATDLVGSIFENFRFLGAVLDRHEATIHRRWLKKTNKLRLKVILEAWGAKMAASHRPDFEAIELESEYERLQGTAYRDSYLWPYINEEDLCKPKSLLLLMSTRARCHPSALAATEHDAHRIGQRLLAFRSSSPGQYFMDLVSHGDEDCYGKLWSHHSYPDKCAVLKARSYTSPAVGLLVLEAQERVLSFLRNCVKLLLHDFTEDSMLLSPPLDFVPTLDAKTNNGYASWAEIAAEAPYRRPTGLDFDRITSLLAAKRDEAADHLWSLREDPSYFEAHMLESKEHRGELILDSRGRQHPVCSLGREDQFWARVVGQQVYYAHFKLEIFAELTSLSEELRNLQNAHADVLETTSDFPEPYTDLLQQFRFHLIEVANSLVSQLGQAWNASPPVRIYYQREIETDPATQVKELRTITSFHDDPTRARIYWLLSRLWSKDDLCNLLGLTNVVDELQRLITSEPATRCTSPYVGFLVGELVLAGALLRQLELYQPWADIHGKISKARHAHLLLANARRSTSQMDLHIGLGLDKQDHSLGSLGAPTGGKFTFPVAKRRTRENVEAMRSAEDNLDKLWRKVDEVMRSKSDEVWNKSLERLGLPALHDADFETSLRASGAAHHLLTRGRKLQRTAAWTEPEREINHTPDTNLYVPFSQLYIGNQKSDEQTLRKNLIQPAKEKTKTRKPGNLGTPASEAETVIPESQGQAWPQFALNTRAFKVFKTLFFSPSTTSTPGEVAWSDFLYAMVAVGFVPEKLYGSVWQFSPDRDKLAVERSIQFHEPHGANTKILYRIARRHGRRLNRAYGWDGSSFTLEEKSK